MLFNNFYLYADNNPVKNFLPAPMFFAIGHFILKQLFLHFSLDISTCFFTLLLMFRNGANGLIHKRYHTKNWDF